MQVKNKTCESIKSNVSSAVGPSLKLKRKLNFSHFKEFSNFGDLKLTFEGQDPCVGTIRGDLEGGIDSVCQESLRTNAAEKIQLNLANLKALHDLLVKEDI